MAQTAQTPVAAFMTCRDADTQAIIHQAQNAHGRARRIASMPRKRELALTTNGNVNPVGTASKYYLEAAVGYVVGQFRDNGTFCAACWAGRGRFPFCVTVTDPQSGEEFLGGACVDCKFQSHHGNCSLCNGNGNGQLAPLGDGGGNGHPPHSPNDDDEDTMDEDKPVIERETRGRASGKENKPIPPEEGDDGSDMDEEMTEAGDEEESDANYNKGKGKQPAVIEESESDTGFKSAHPSRHKSTRGVALPKGKQPGHSSKTIGAKAGIKAGKGKAREGIKKNPDGSRKRE